MTRRDLARRIAARKRLHAIAWAAARDLAIPEPVYQVVRQRAPELAKLVGDRELRAIVEISCGPLAS
jgi:hypothetical protein